MSKGGKKRKMSRGGAKPKKRMVRGGAKRKMSKGGAKKRRSARKKR